MNKQELTEVMREVLHEHRQIDDEKHQIHHDFIEMEIKRRERSAQRWEKFRLSAIGAVAVTIVGVLVWVGKLVLSAVSHGAIPR